jgi:hypothetical protein
MYTGANMLQTQQTHGGQKFPGDGAALRSVSYICMLYS